MTRRAARFEGIELSPIRRIQALATPLTINLGLGEPNIEPDAWLRGLARDAAAEGSWRYSMNAGLPELRERIAEEEAPHYDPASEICVTAGTEEGLHAVFQAYLQPGDEVLVPDPGFLSYPVLAGIAGATPVPYALDPETWDAGLEPLRAAWSERTRAIVVNSPSNPTGGVLPEATVRAIVDLAAERDALVVSDEVYREIYYEAAPPSFAGRGGHVIVVSGMSKSHGMTGLRLGWVLASADVMAAIVTAHQYIATCASTFAQELALRILAAPEANAEWLSRVRAQFAGQRRAAVDAAARELDVDLAPPAGAFYLFVPVPLCGTEALARALAGDAGVLTIPGSAFGRGGEGFLRISFAADEETIARGIERIGRHLRASGR
ncbi:MAG: pyridoxal phosphate-dependent aminotransferase [Thermoanaerobaculia bacterium]